MRYLAFCATLAAGLLLGTTGTAQAQTDDPEELFVVVTTDDAQTQMMAMVLANQSLNQGASVRVLLCGAGGRLALADEEFPAFQPADRTPQQLLQNLINEGVTVDVCAIFLPNTDANESDLIEGIGTARPPAIAEHMMKPGVRPFTF
jgi:predicted peroxiredoxin